MVYAFRHQAAGILIEFLFAEEPTAEQTRAVEETCLHRHGDKHPKTGEVYWLRVIQLPLLAADAVIETPAQAAARRSEAALKSAGVSGVAVVRNPGA